MFNRLTTAQDELETFGLMEIVLAGPPGGGTRLVVDGQGFSGSAGDPLRETHRPLAARLPALPRRCHDRDRGAGPQREPRGTAGHIVMRSALQLPSMCRTGPRDGPAHLCQHAAAGNVPRPSYTLSRPLPLCRPLPGEPPRPFPHLPAASKGLRELTAVPSTVRPTPIAKPLLGGSLQYVF